MLNNLEHLHVFVSTQGAQVVLQGVLTERSEEKDAELHEHASSQVDKCRGHNFLFIFYIF